MIVCWICVAAFQSPLEVWLASILQVPTELKWTTPLTNEQPLEVPSRLMTTATGEEAELAAGV